MFRRRWLPPAGRSNRLPQGSPHIAHRTVSRSNSSTARLPYTPPAAHRRIINPASWSTRPGLPAWCTELAL